MPYAVFVDYNEVEWTTADEEKYLKLTKPPADFQDHLKDLLLLGKREIMGLIKWRMKLRDCLQKADKARFKKIEYKNLGEDEEEVGAE
jgi:AdoMet-dependent rRNA methyltransferase SPB1